MHKVEKDVSFFNGQSQTYFRNYLKASGDSDNFISNL